MEPGVREFLKRIMLTIFIGLFWLILNSTVGIMYNYAFFDDSPGLANILFYLWFIGSGLLLFWYLRRMWNKPVEGSDEDQLV